MQCASCDCCAGLRANGAATAELRRRRRRRRRRGRLAGTRMIGRSPQLHVDAQPSACLSWFPGHGAVCTGGGIRYRATTSTLRSTMSAGKGQPRPMARWPQTPPRPIGWTCAGACFCSLFGPEHGEPNLNTACKRRRRPRRLRRAGSQAPRLAGARASQAILSAIARLAVAPWRPVTTRPTTASSDRLPCHARHAPSWACWRAQAPV